MDGPVAALHAHFGGVTFAALTASLERSTCLPAHRCTWPFSFLLESFDPTKSPELLVGSDDDLAEVTGIFHGSEGFFGIREGEGFADHWMQGVFRNCSVHSCKI